MNQSVEYPDRNATMKRTSVWLPLGALALAPDRESIYSRNSTSGSPLKCGPPLTTFAPSDFAVA